MIEMGIAIIAGCLPTIWPLLSKVSLENMVRTVRSVLSIESLRDSLGRGSTKSKNKSGGGGDKLDPSNDEGGPYVQFSDGIHDGTRSHSKSQSQEGIIGVNRSVEIKRSKAHEYPELENIPMQDLGVRTVTQVSSSANMRHGDSYV